MESVTAKRTIFTIRFRTAVLRCVLCPKRARTIANVVVICIVRIKSAHARRTDIGIARRLFVVKLIRIYQLYINFAFLTFNFEVFYFTLRHDKIKFS